jgi:hypothetical protein
VFTGSGKVGFRRGSVKSFVWIQGDYALSLPQKDDAIFRKLSVLDIQWLEEC